MFSLSSTHKRSSFLPHIPAPAPLPLEGDSSRDDRLRYPDALPLRFINVFVTSFYRLLPKDKVFPEKGLREYADCTLSRMSVGVGVVVFVIRLFTMNALSYQVNFLHGNLSWLTSLV